MLRYLKEYRFYVALFFFVLIPIISIDTTNRAPRDYRFYDRVIVAFTAPIQSMISWTLDTVVATYQNYLYLFQTRKDNVALLEENRKLLNTIAELKEKALENERLRALIGLKEKYQINTVAARVISRDMSTEFRTVRINRGEADGIRPNMAVVNTNGVVGRIWRVTHHTADVITLLDLLSAVDVIAERSRARGIVEGMTNDVCQLKYALRTDDLQQGDLLLTSGLGGIFPKGVPVGTVSKVFKKPYGITQVVEVTPAVDFGKLEEVLVITEFKDNPIPLSEVEATTKKAKADKSEGR